MNWYSKVTIDWLIPGLLAKSFIPDNGRVLSPGMETGGIQSVVNLLESHFDDIARQERAAGIQGTAFANSGHVCPDH